MNNSTMRRASPAMIAALAALVLAAAATVFALAGSAMAGRSPTLKVRQEKKAVVLAAMSSSTKTVRCPSGFKVVSASYDFDPGVNVTLSHRDSRRTWRSSASNETSGPNDWVLYAICAKVS
jgi:hypothetical protein